MMSFLAWNGKDDLGPYSNKKERMLDDNFNERMGRIYWINDSNQPNDNWGEIVEYLRGLNHTHASGLYSAMNKDDRTDKIDTTLPKTVITNEETYPSHLL